MKLHPKILAALLAAIGVAIVSVANTAVGVYPDEAWAHVVEVLIPVVAGWFPKSPEPASVVVAVPPPA